MKSVSRRAVIQSLLMTCAGLAAACSASSSSTSPAATPGTTAAVPALSPSAGAAGASPAVVPSPSPTATPGPPVNVTSAPVAGGTAVRGAWVAQTANQMIFPLALEAGYFGQNGINFDLSYINGSNTGIAGLLSRSLDVISAAGSAVVSAQAAGSTDVVMIAGFINQAIFRIMAASEIQAIGDLRGKNIGVTKIGNADYFAWQIIATQYGYAMNDFHFINSGDVPGQVALLQQGQVQAVAVSPPNDVLCTQVGAVLLLDTATLDYPEQNVGLVVTKEYMASNTAALTNVVKACIQAMARWKSDAAYTQTVINKYLPNPDPQFTQVGYSAYAPLWPQVPLPSVLGMQQVITEVSSQNPASNDLNVNQLIDTTIVQQIQSSGFIQQVYGGGPAASPAPSGVPVAPAPSASPVVPASPSAVPA